MIGLLLVETIVMCFALLIVCVVGIANGPAGLVVLYEEDVQQRVVELGYMTRAQLKKTFVTACIALFLPVFVLTPLMVYGLNGATGFWEGFWQMSVILVMSGLFDRFFIDWYWVGKILPLRLESIKTTLWPIFSTFSEEVAFPFMPLQFAVDGVPEHEISLIKVLAHEVKSHVDASH